MGNQNYSEDAKSTQDSPPRPAALPQTTPIWKKPWLWFVGSIAAIALLLSNINSILSNARTLPGEVQKTSDQFFEWYAEYDAWKGTWSNDPEGFVDAAALNLSKEAFRLTIDESGGGGIGGTIETKGICEKTPISEELLIDGSISSAHRATIYVFDFVGGYRRNFAELALRRDGYVMTVTPVNDPAGLFEKQTRIAQFPAEYKLGDPDSDANGNLRPICPGKEAKFVNDVVDHLGRKQASKPTK